MREQRSHIIIQTGFIGDIALTMFLLEEIKSLQPTDRIIFVTTPVGSEIARAYPNIIDEVIIYDKRGKHSGWKGIQLMIQTIREYSADTLISLHHSFRTSLIVAGSRVPVRAGYKSSALSFVYTSRHHYTKGIHEVERQRTFLFLYKNNVNIAEQSHRRALLSALTHPELFSEQSSYIMVAPGSVWNTKKWPQHHFKTLLSSLLEQQTHSIMLIGSESDRSLCESIIPDAFRDRIHNAAGTMSLDGTLHAMKNAAFLIANDSAPIHLASLVNCPTIAIFGPTHPAFGFAPMADDSNIIQKNMECRPCSIHGQSTCPLGNHACMEDIHPNDVLQVALKYFS